MSSDISTRRIIVQSTVGLGSLFALLFGCAGTLAWTEAWLFILIQTSALTIMVLWLKKHNPELLQERMDLWKRVVKSWDKAIVILLIAASAPFFALPGLDAIRYQWSYVPLPLKVMGFVGMVLSYSLIFWVVRTNPYSSAAVEIQEDRGHKVITTGPYQYVRHPMYVGATLLIFSIPLALGSVLTFIPAIILAGLIVVRIYLEDKHCIRSWKDIRLMRKQFITGLFPESGRFGPGDYQSVKLLIAGSHPCMVEENQDGRNLHTPRKVKKAFQI